MKRSILVGYRDRFAPTGRTFTAINGHIQAVYFRAKANQERVIVVVNKTLNDTSVLNTLT